MAVSAPAFAGGGGNTFTITLSVAEQPLVSVPVTKKVVVLAGKANGFALIGTPLTAVTIIVDGGVDGSVRGLGVLVIAAGIVGRLPE